jgi:tol-pal system protein YbgF
MKSTQSTTTVMLAALMALLAPVAVASMAKAQSGAGATVADQAGEIEQRLIDLQVQIATARSLNGSKSSPQIASLEDEVRTLARSYRKLSGKPSSIRPNATTAIRPGAAAPPPTVLTPPAGGQSGASGWFGSTTVTPGAEPPREGQQSALLQENPFPGREQPPGGAVAGAPNPNAAPIIPGAPLPNSVGSAKTEYEAAYSYLLQQDYGAAQSAFSEFLKRHPDADLAGNAQYWLGETHYVRGAYRKAAVAFLKGYEKYGKGNKGADSLLKLGLSLAKLKQTEAACSSLRELGTRYPNAPRAVLDRGKSELRRLRCSS